MTVTQSRRLLTFAQLIADMGDFSDLAQHNVALKFWLPEAAEQALDEMSERNDLSTSKFLRQFFAIHCYGLYVFTLMIECMPRLFKEQTGVLFSRCEMQPPLGKKRIDTYWVPELRKNVAPIKVWVPKRLKYDLQILSDHAGITLSNYAREIVISRLLSHGMLHQRPEMLKAFPEPAASEWDEDREAPWREVSEDEFFRHKIREMRTEWIDDGTRKGNSS